MASQSFQELTQAIQHATSVKQAAIELIKTMGDKLNDMANHPTPDQVRQLANELRSHADELANAVSTKGGAGGGGGDQPEPPEPAAARKK